MKKITMFMMETCPYCQEALRWMDILLKENPAYASLEIEKIDEKQHPEIANEFDYDYVPAYYINGEKLHEGAASLEKIRYIFDEALK